VTVLWEEKITRGAAIALMNNFTSVAEALKELVDNPIDYRQGQHLEIDILDKHNRGLVVVESDGGRGMDADGIGVWLSWGEGEHHGEGHIGRWHQGGKAACGFLGSHVRLWAKKASSDDIWYLEDKGWSSRTEARSFGVPKPISRSQYPETMQTLPRDRGHVRIEVRGLQKTRRWNMEALRRDVSSTYRDLILTGDVAVRINGETVSPLEIPLSTAVERVEIGPIRLTGGRSAKGWAARMMKDQLEFPIKSGLRLIHNGRLIAQGEWFGYNYEGKGALASLIGDIHLSGFRPNPNKTDFVDRGDQVWDGLSEAVLEQLKPLIATLRKSGDESRITKDEKKRVSEVADELEKVFQAIHEAPVDLAGGAVGSAVVTEAKAAGRRPPSASSSAHRGATNGGNAAQSPRQPRTPPPDDAVGKLARLLSKISGGRARPPLRIRAWDETERSSWTNEEGGQFLDINKNYHMYRSLQGHKAYLAESAILQLNAPKEGESVTAAEYIERVSLMLIKWAHVVSSGPL
jgi:hypothetical protein